MAALTIRAHQSFFRRNTQHRDTHAMLLTLLVFHRFCRSTTEELKRVLVARSAVAVCVSVQLPALRTFHADSVLDRGADPFFVYSQYIL